MPLFEFEDHEALGNVKSVDTASVVVSVANLDLLRKLQVNRLVALQSSKPGQHLIGIVQRITRNAADPLPTEDEEADEGETTGEINLVRIALIGTLIDRVGTAGTNVFRRTLETVPEIAANCFSIEGQRLTDFMRAISQLSNAEGQRLSLGHYTLDDDAETFLNGNKFFQRHALIVGSTGSGKSWTTARVLEQVASLPNANAIVFDIHGEYKTLSGPGIRHFRVAGPGDLGSGESLDAGVVYLPYWLLGYEDMIDMLLDRSDQNAPNQAMVFSRTVVDVKKAYLEQHGLGDVLDNFTIDSPVPYSLRSVVSQLNALNVEMVESTRGQKQGDFYGKLSRFIARLENKLADRRLGFMFAGPAETEDYDWLPKLAKSIMAGTRDQDDSRGGVKVLDFSEVPSDVLPVIVSLVARLVFYVQQWTPREHRHPIALFCDEAHLYIPESSEGGTDDAAVRTFTRIAKEGRKYGVGLVVISQRPSEVNRTVLSQCNNVVAMRLTNAEDQSVVRRLLPDSLGGFSDLLPILDIGEALVVGDASLLPSRVRIEEPTCKPDSGTIDFWDLWASDSKAEAISEAVTAWRKQSLK
ncbi:MAG: ATP-binding protein [Bacillota bacterium]